MKKVNMFLGLLSAAAIVFACAKEENPGANEGTQDDTQKEEVTPGEDDKDQTGGEADENAMAYFFAVTEGADVKVSIGQDGATALEDGDVAVVYVPATGASCNYVYSASAGRFAAAEGSTAVTLDGNEAWVCYPADYFTVSQEEAGVALSIPASVATAGGYKSPMAGKLVSGTEGQEVELKNIGSILRVNLTSAFPQAPETVTAVRLNSNAGISAAALSFENELPALSEVSGETSVIVELGETGLVLSETAATVHFFVPAEVEASLSVDVCYGKAGWEAAPYTRVERKSALTAVRAELYDIDFAAGLFSGGDGSEANPYLIASAADFKALATAVNSKDAPQYGATSAGTFFGSAGAHYQQTADIDFADGESKGDLSDYMIGSSSAPFKGSYNGKNGETQHTISNFAITGTDNTGLFGYCAGAVISNVKVAGASLTGVQNIACIIGYANKGTVSGCETTDDCSVVATDANVAGISGNCYGGAEFNACINRASITVDGEEGNNFGGIVGYTDNGKLVGCHNYGTISGTKQVGGISGRLNSGSITDCVNEGAVSGTGANIGGIVCTLTAGTVSGCTNSGTVTGGASYVGGVVGDQLLGTVEACSNSGDVTSESGNYVAGVVGRMGTTGAGTNNRAIVKACISEGDIMGANSVAAIVGGTFFGAIHECCAKGSVNGNAYVGGLVGYIITSKGRVGVFDSFAKAIVTGKDETGGVIGSINYSSSNYTTINNCIGNNASITADSNVGSFVGKVNSTADVKYIRVKNNFTMMDTILDFVGAVGKATIQGNYYVYGPDSSSYATKKQLTEIDVTLMSNTLYWYQSFPLINNKWTVNPTSWTTVEGVAYPLPSGLVAHGEEYYK